jgi:hypothetical protein
MNKYTITVTVTVDVEATNLRNTKEEAIYQA